jgi:hypothetical protein
MVGIRVGLFGCLLMLAGGAIAEDLGIVNRKRIEYSESEFPKEFLRQYNEVYGRFLIAPEGAEYRKFRYFGNQLNNGFGDAEGWVWQDEKTKNHYAVLRSGRVIAVQKVGEKVEIEPERLQRNFYRYSYVENLLAGSNLMSAAVFLAFGETKAAEFLLQELQFTGGSGPAPVINWGNNATLEDQFVQARYYDYMLALNSRSAEVAEWSALQLRDSNAKILRKTLNYGELFTDPNLMIREARRFRTQPEFRLELSQLGWMTKEDQIKSLVESLAWGASSEVQERLATYGPEVIPLLIDCYEKEDRLSPNYPYSVSSWIPTVRDRLLATLSRIWICIPIDPVYSGRINGQYVSADFLRSEWEKQKNLRMVDRIARGLILTNGKLARTWVPRLLASVGESDRISEKQARNGAIRLDEMKAEDRKALIVMIQNHVYDISQFGKFDRETDYADLLVLLSALDERQGKEYLRKYFSWALTLGRIESWEFRSSLGRLVAQRIALGDRDRALSDFSKIIELEKENRHYREEDFISATEFSEDAKVQKFFGEYFKDITQRYLGSGQGGRDVVNFTGSLNIQILRSPGVRDQISKLMDSDVYVGIWRSDNNNRYVSIGGSIQDTYNTYYIDKKGVVSFSDGKFDATVGSVFLMWLNRALTWSPWPICSEEEMKKQFDFAKRDLKSGKLELRNSDGSGYLIWRPRR